MLNLLRNDTNRIKILIIYRLVRKVFTYSTNGIIQDSFCGNGCVEMVRGSGIFKGQAENIIQLYSANISVHPQ